MFENTAGDYHELNAGAHRKHPKILAAPSLVWHLAFWTNCQARGPDGAPLTKHDGSPWKKGADDIKEALDRYILALRRTIDEAERPQQRDTAGGSSTRKIKVALSPCISSV